MTAPTGNVAVDALALVVDALEAAKVEYAITGSFAATYYGVVRATADADVKVRAADLDAALAEVEKRLRAGGCRRLDETTFRYRERFDIELYPTVGSLDEEALARRVRVPLLPASPREFDIVTLEDLLLIKAREYQKYPDQKHVDDARKLLVANRRNLDVDYLVSRLKRHDLLRAWEKHVEPGA